MVDLHIKFKSRRPGTFGSSPVGKFAEWVTTTWLRFTCTLFTALFVTLALASSIPPADKLTTLAVAPVAALMLWYFFLFSILLCEYLGTFGKLLSRLLVVYFYLFSWLVVQHPPTVDLGLTK